MCIAFLSDCFLNRPCLSTEAGFKNWRGRVFVAALIAVFCPLLLLQGQPARANRVLELDGRGSYVELPPKIFDGLSEVTVEAWVKWNRFGYFSQWFSTGGTTTSLSIGNADAKSNLGFTIRQSSEKYRTIRVENILQLGKWHHVAAVVGKNGMKLYLNGLLVGSQDFTVNFEALQTERRTLVGRSIRSKVIGDVDFQGQVDELRIWRVARTEDEIKAGLFRMYSGTEPDLAGLWNFDDDTANDASPNQDHGHLIGRATIVESQISGEAQLTRPAVIFGRVTGIQGEPVALAEISLRQAGANLGKTKTGANGDYQIAFYPQPGPIELSAVLDPLGTENIEVSLSPMERKQVNLSMRDRTAVTGRVLAFDQSPLNAVVVEALAQRGGGNLETSSEGSTNFVQVVATSISNAQGEYRLSHLSPGAYRIRCQIKRGYVNYDNGASVIYDGRNPKSGVDMRLGRILKGTSRKFTVLDGLADNVVRDFRSDDHGALWFATFGGVTRYDGTRFTNFTPEDGLAHNRVTSIARDNSSNLWFGTWKGLSRYDGRHWKTFNTTNGLPDLFVNALFCGSDGVLWVGTDGGVARYEEARGFEVFATQNGLPENHVHAICRTRDGAMWFGTQFGGAARYDGNQFELFSSANGLGSDDIRVIHQDAHGDLWFGTGGDGLVHYDGKNFSKITTKEGLLDDMVYAIYEDANGVLWIGTERGVSRREGPTFVHFNLGLGLNQERVQKIYGDADGGLWFATENGAFRYDENSFTSYTIADGLAHNQIRSIQIANDGAVWLGTAGGGVSRFDGNHFINYTSRNGLGANWVSSIHQDADGALWFGTTTADPLDPRGTATLSRYAVGGKNNGAARFTNFGITNGLDAGRAISQIERDAQGTLWLATWGGGLVRYREGEEFSNLPCTRGLRTNVVTSFFQDRRGNFWLGTWAGLFQFDPLTWRTQKETSQGISFASLMPDRTIMSMVNSATGDIWLSMLEGGVARYHPGDPTGRGESVINYTRSKERLAHNAVSAVFEDTGGVVWFGTDAGVTRFTDGLWSTLNERDGLPGHIISCIAQDRFGAFWFGTDQGVARYQRTQSHPQRPTVTVQTDREYSSADAVPSVSQKGLVIFRFHSIDFKTLPDNQRYRYEIVPGILTRDELKQPQHWQSSTKATLLEWVAPHAGSYTFAVEYIDRDLNRSEPSLVYLNVFPPWYLNAWIAGPVGGTTFSLLLTVAYSYIRYRNKKREAEHLREQMLRQEFRARQTAESSAMALAAKNTQLECAWKAAEDAKETAEQANRSKSQFFSFMSHELRTPLTVIVGYSELLRGAGEQEEHSRFADYADHLSDAAQQLLGLINDVLDLSKIEAGKMTLNLETFAIGELVRRAGTTIQPLASKNGNRLEVDCPAEIGSMRADPMKLRQVLLNLLSNACKFTKQGVIRIEARRLFKAGPMSIDQAAFSVPETPAKTPSENESSNPQAGSGSKPTLPPRRSYVAFQISDTGIGMTPEQVSRLFQPYTQAGSDTSRHFGGTGLGLAISRKFCELMDGDIAVSSESEKGSTFVVTLPDRID